MAEGGDQLSSFIVVDVVGDLKDVEKEESIFEFTKSYLQDVQKCGGGKFASGGFVKNPESQNLQYVAHYANPKSAKRVLDRHEHCIEVNKKNLVLTVRPCPPDLIRVLETESPPSDGEGDGTGNSSNGESSPTEEVGELTGQNRSGSSDIELISHDGANGFTIVDVNKQGSGRHTDDVSPKPQTSEVHPSALSEDPPHSSNLSPCSSPESIDESSAKNLDQWSRSIIIENVPEEMFPTLRLLLENKGMGGGNIMTYERNPAGNQVLATFEDKQAADYFVAGEKLTVMRQIFSVHRPLLLEDTSIEDLTDKDEETATVPDSEVKGTIAAAADSVSEETEDDGQTKVLDEDSSLGYKEENKSKQSDEESGKDERDDEEQNKDKEGEILKKAKQKTEDTQIEDGQQNKAKEEEKLEKAEQKAEVRQMVDEEQNRDIPNKDGSLKDDEAQKIDQDDIKPKKSDVEEETRKEEESRREASEADTAAAKVEDEERVEGAARDAGQSAAVDEESLNTENVSKRKTLSANAAETTMSEKPKAEDLGSTEFELLNPSLDVHKNPESLKSDTSGSGSSLDVPKTPKMIVVKGVTSQTCDTVETFLESSRKGGGPVKEFKFSESDGELSVIFEDDLVADRFLAQKSILLLGNSYYIHAPGTEEPKTESISLEEVDDSKEREAEEWSRTVVVHGVQSKEIAENIVDLLENKRRGGGPIEEYALNESSRSLTVRFQDKKYAEYFIQKEVISILEVKYYIRPPLFSDTQPSESAIMADQKAEEVKMSDDNNEVPEKPATKVDDERDESEALENTTVHTGKLTEEPVGKPKEEPQEDSDVGDPCLIEVQGIPDKANDTVVIMIFEDKRYSGIEDVGVTDVRMLEGGRALLAIRDPQHAKALIEKGSVAFKHHTLGISRPSKPERPVEEVKESAQPPFSDRDTKETPGEYTADNEELVSESKIIDVSNIPEDMSEDVLLMIFENKRYGGGEVTNIVYEKGRGSAVITMSDPEVVKRLLHQESVVYKKSKLLVTKPVKEERSQKPFPPRKRNNAVPTIEKEQPLSPDRVIKVSNIPSSITKEALEMVFENKRYKGGETDNIVYDQRKGTAVITFKDPEVAKTLIQQEVLIYKGNRLAITRYEKESIEDCKQDETSPVSSRMVDVGDIPPGMTLEVLSMLLENSSNGEIESIDHDQNRNTAVATFKDSVAADILISEESVVYKEKRLSIRRHVEKVDERKQFPKAEKKAPATSNRLIFVHQIPPKLNKEYLVMFFESKRSGGGKTEDVDYDPAQGTAVITFEDSKVAASFIEREVVDFKGHRIFIKKHEDETVDAGRGKDSDDDANVKELPSPKYVASGSFNTVKISGIPKDVSKEMISMYFENKKRSGGGRHRVLEHQKEKGKVVIMFHNPEDGLEVCKRLHVLSGATVDICALEMPLDDVKSCAIEVKGLTERASVNFLELYFENTGRSGGGTVEKVFLNKEAKTAIVVFEEATAVLGVMKKMSHKFDGASVEVNVLEAAPPPPMLLTDADAKRLLAKRLPPSTTRESLREYLSVAARAKLVGWTLAVKPSTALLDFSSEPDYLSICRLICSKPFLGTMISIRRVPQTSSVLVTGLPPSVTPDHVAMYFENPRNGGNGEECRVEILPDKGSAIVKFERPDIIPAITSRSHRFEGKEIKVEPYYPWLGRISASQSSGTAHVKTESKIPTSLTFTFDPRAAHFILKRQDFQKHIEVSLEKINCCIVWPSEGKGEVKLEFKGKEKQKPASGWDTECKKFLQKYDDELTWKKIDVLQEIWNDFKTKIQGYVAEKSKLLDIAFENDKCEIHYMGLKKNTDDFEKIVKEITGDLETKLERRKQRISENLANIRPYQLALLKTDDFKKKLSQAFPNTEFDVKEKEVDLSGMPDVVKKAKLFILEKVSGIVEDSFEISESTRKVFAKEEAKSYLMEQLLNKGISASWMCNDRSVIVYAWDKKSLDEAVQVLKNEVTEIHVQLSEANMGLVQSTEWKKFVESLYNDHKSLEIVILGSTVVAVCMRDIADGVKKRLNGFIEKHAILERRMPMDFGVVDVIKNYMKEELQKLVAELKECSGSISSINDEPGFIIKGNEAGVGKAAKEIQELTDKIIMYDHDIDRPGIPAYFYSRHGKEVLRGIQINHKVSIQLDNTQSRPKPEAAGGEGPWKCRVEVRPGKFMTLMRGDITKSNVDAIVNAANEDLNHIGGVAAAIAEAAGQDLEDDCYIRIKMEGKLLPGQACATRAGKLRCKKVIHAVGPRWKGGKDGEENILAMAVDSSLAVADTEGLKSIAMPSISTGIFGFPLDLATDIIVDAVKSYLVDNSSTTVREVFFIDNDSRAVASLEKRLKVIQADGPPERPEDRKGRRVTAGSQEFRSPQSQERPPSTNQRGSSATPTSGFQGVSSGVIRTADGVKISLVKGSISELQADVLVNTTGKELILSHGNVSKSLLAAAGPNLQAEVDTKKPPNFDYGQIVVTGGQRLQCRFVYHGACRGWDNGAGGCETTVRAFMKNILEKAEADKQKSVAIPAIGTGNLKIPHKIVTEIMYSEVEKFSKQRKPMNLLDVRFVVYDKDRESIKAFEDKIQDLLRPGGSRGSAGGGAGAGSYSPSSRPTSFGASSSPFTSSSTMSSSGPDFSFDAVNKVIRVGSIVMKLKSGDITKESADAIVNSTNDRMDMTGGAVAKAILSAGGRTVEMECKRAKMSSRRVCVTSGGNLPAKNIIHLVAGYTPVAWREVIENTLEEAEDRGYRNIVFPMLGTGQIGQSAASMASIMVDAVCEFNKNKRPKSLKEIVVCIFQSSMLNEFVDAVATKGASRSFMDRATGALGAGLGWIGSKVRSFGAAQDNGYPVDNDDFSDDQAGATTAHRTRAVAGPRQPSEESQVERQPQHLSRIILSIYALSLKAKDDALKDIEEMIKEYIIDKVLDSAQDQENITKLNPEQIKRIKAMKDIFPVQIEVETGRLKRIRIRGPPMEVTLVMDQVHAIFQEAHKKEIQKKEEEYIGSTVHWEYDDGGSFEKYPDEINVIIEKAYRDKKPYAEWEEETAKYRLTFQTSTEEFLTDNTKPPIKVRRVAKDVDTPTNWAPMANDEDLKRVQLSPTDQEYIDVEKAAKSTAQTTLNQVVKIERIQNKLLCKQYTVRKVAMDAANPGVQNEMTLWHGTSADTLESINRTGFNRSYCGKNAIVYGRGVYFAKNFSYSAQNTYSPPDPTTGLKHIYQCKVLTGEYVLGNNAMIVPPPNPTNATKKYDSTVDNVTTPTIFVIFYDTQAFPEYLIYFK